MPVRSAKNGFVDKRHVSSARQRQRNNKLKQTENHHVGHEFNDLLLSN